MRADNLRVSIEHYFIFDLVYLVYSSIYIYIYIYIYI